MFLPMHVDSYICGTEGDFCVVAIFVSASFLAGSLI